MPILPLPRREKQALDALYRLGEATAAQIMAEVGDVPSYSAARGLMTQLLNRGLVRVKEGPGRQYVYVPTTPAQNARKGALRQVMETFFENSPVKLAANLLDPGSQRLSANEIQELRALLDAHDDAAAPKKPQKS